MFKKLRAKTAKATDGRVRLISELLNGILSVKAFAWEEPCLEAVAAARSKEASTVLRAQWCRSLGGSLLLDDGHVSLRHLRGLLPDAAGSKTECRRRHVIGSTC